MGKSFSIFRALFLLCVLVGSPVFAEHGNTLGQSLGRGIGAQGGQGGQGQGQGGVGDQALGGQGQGQGGQGGAGGQAATYQKNETTKEIAKAAEKYQTQITEAQKNALSGIKEQTNNFLTSLDKLKVPETGSELLKQIGEMGARATASTGSSKSVDELTEAIKANGNTQVETLKAVAQRFAPTAAPASSQPPPPKGPSVAQQLQAASAGMRPPSGSALDLAMGATLDPAKTGAGANTRVLTDNMPRTSVGASSQPHGGTISLRGMKGASPVKIYNPPTGVKIEQ